MVGAIILQIVLILLNAIFAAAEIAVISCNGKKLEKMAEEGDKRARRIVSLTERPAKFLSTIQVAITLAGLLGSAFAADFFAEPLAGAIMSLGVKESARGVIETVCVILVTIILAFFNITFGELIPKRLAMKSSEKLALALSGTLTGVSVVFAPLVWLLTVTANGVLKLFGVKAEEDDKKVTEEEIILMAEAGRETGQIDEQENEMIQNVFEFKENSAGDVCTHRKDVVILFTYEDDESWNRTIMENKHIYYPVCGKDADDVVGILDTKIYFRLPDKSRSEVMEKAVRPAFFVPENLTANNLFYKMQESKEHIMVVVDEYGGMRGIVTIKDLLELLVGEMTDKDEEEDYTVERVDENSWKVKGLLPIEEAEDLFGIKPDEEEEYETFSGYVLGKLENVPADGDTPELADGDLTIKVQKVEKRRITEMTVTRNVPESAEEKEQKKED